MAASTCSLMPEAGWPSEEYPRLDGLGCFSLSAPVQAISKDEVTKRATIQLLMPELLTSRVDHSRTQTWQVRKTAWMPWSGDGDKLRDQVMKEAQKLVAQAAASQEYVGQSRAAVLSG